MKKVLLIAVLAGVSVAFAEKKDAYDIRPDAAKAADALSAVDWQNKNDAALKAATSDAALAEIVADDDNAEKLLAKLKGAYLTDPLVAFQVAAVTQWTMVSDPWYCLFWGEHALGRKVWVKCLFEQIDRTDDEYVKTFCLDQLRWCAWPDQAEEIREIGTKSGSKVLRDFAAVVALELESRR